MSYPQCTTEQSHSARHFRTFTLLNPELSSLGTAEIVFLPLIRDTSVHEAAENMWGTETASSSMIVPTVRQGCRNVLPVRCVFEVLSREDPFFEQRFALCLISTLAERPAFSLCRWERDKCWQRSEQRPWPVNGFGWCSASSVTRQRGGGRQNKAAGYFRREVRHEKGVAADGRGIRRHTPCFTDMELSAINNTYFLWPLLNFIQGIEASLFPVPADAADS